jgi:hypothetical protein
MESRCLVESDRAFQEEEFNMDRCPRLEKALVLVN